MKITIESTSKIVDLDGVPGRVWEGVSEGGVKVICFITRIVAQTTGQDLKQLEAELQEQRVPSEEAKAIPLRLIL
jgi:hypothetical protein